MELLTNSIASITASCDDPQGPLDACFVGARGGLAARAFGSAGDHWAEVGACRSIAVRRRDGLRTRGPGDRGRGGYWQDHAATGHPGCGRGPLLPAADREGRRSGDEAVLCGG